MTPVEFTFVLPTGVALANTVVEVQLSRSSHVAQHTGVTMPRPVSFTTDNLGKFVMTLWPSSTLYYVHVVDPVSGAEIFHKFLVPEVAPDITVRLQDIILDAEMSGVSYDDAALLSIHAAKAEAAASAVAAQGSAILAAASAATVSSTVADVTALIAPVPGYVTAAGAHVTTASGHATSASNSAAAASNDANTVAASLATAAAHAAAALVSKDAAAASATAADSSEATALSHKNAAAASAATAASSIVDMSAQVAAASGSASSASGSASAAASSVTSATTQANAASASASAALVSKNDAAASAAAALISQTSAAASVTTASGHATAAYGSATTATTKAGEASGSAAAAAASALEATGNARVTVKSYGAIGNGVADDTAAIQACINGEEVVYFPEGLYKTTATLNLKTGTHIDGDGMNCAKIMKQNFDGPAIQGVDTNYIIIEGISVIGPGRDTGWGDVPQRFNKGIVIKVTVQEILESIAVRDITVTEMNDFGIYFGTVAYASLSNIRVRNVGFAAFYIDGGDGISITGCTTRFSIVGFFINRPTGFGPTTVSMLGCYAEQHGCGIYLNGAVSCSMIGCGVEAPINFDSTWNGKSYWITGASRNITIQSCLGRNDTIGAAIAAPFILIDGASTNIIVDAFDRVLHATYLAPTWEFDSLGCTNIRLGWHNFTGGTVRT